MPVSAARLDSQTGERTRNRAGDMLHETAKKLHPARNGKLAAQE
jgi:hypothetical protein